MNLYLSAVLHLLVLTSFNTINIGKQQTRWLTNKDGKKIRKESEKQWNRQGDIIRSVEYTDGMRPFNMEFSYEYQDGNKVKASNLLNHEFTIYTYDKTGRLKQELLYTSSKKLEEKTIYTYNGNSKHFSSSHTYKGNEQVPYMSSTFEYYPNELIKKEIQTSGGAWFLTNEYKYDSKGHLVYESSIADGGVGLVKTYYTYAGDVLIKDMVKVPDAKTEYHFYETTMK